MRRQFFSQWLFNLKVPFIAKRKEYLFLFLIGSFFNNGRFLAFDGVGQEIANNTFSGSMLQTSGLAFNQGGGIGL
jgi:hypothetical protein